VLSTVVVVLLVVLLGKGLVASLVDELTTVDVEYVTGSGEVPTVEGLKARLLVVVVMVLLMDEVDVG
jgi:hypothetical protein